MDDQTGEISVNNITIYTQLESNLHKNLHYLDNLTKSLHLAVVQYVQRGLLELAAPFAPSVDT